MNNNNSSLYCDKDHFFQENCIIEYISSHQMALHYVEMFGNSQVEIFPNKTLNINNNLE